MSSVDTRLHLACKEGDLDQVKNLVDVHHSNINREDEFGTTPLYWASLCGHLEVVKYLLKNGAYCRVDSVPAYFAYNVALTEAIRNVMRNHSRHYHGVTRGSPYATIQPPNIWRYVSDNSFMSLFECESWQSKINESHPFSKSKRTKMIRYAVLYNNKKAMNVLILSGAFETIEYNFNDLLMKANSKGKDTYFNGDIILRCSDNVQIHVHSCIIFARCPNFINQFVTKPINWLQFSTFYGSDDSTPLPFIIDLNTIPSDVLKMYLKFMYTDLRPPYHYQSVQLSRFKELHIPPYWQKSNYIKELYELINNPICSDIIIQINKLSIFCHKPILSSRSRFFRENFKENSEISVIELTDIIKLNNPEISMLHIIEFIYTNGIYHLQGDDHVLGKQSETVKKKIRKSKTEETLVDMCIEILFKHIGMNDTSRYPGHHSYIINNMIMDLLIKTSSFENRKSALFIELSKFDLELLVMDLLELSKLFVFPELTEICTKYLTLHPLPLLTNQVMLKESKVPYPKPKYRKWKEEKEWQKLQRSNKNKKLTIDKKDGNCEFDGEDVLFKI